MSLEKLAERPRLSLSIGCFMFASKNWMRQTKRFVCTIKVSKKCEGVSWRLVLFKCFMATALVKVFNKVLSSKVTDITAQRLTQLTDSGFTLCLSVRESRSFFTDSTILDSHVSPVEQSRDTKLWPKRGHFITAAVGAGEMSCVQFASTSPFKPSPTHRTFNTPYSSLVQLLYNQCCIS